MVKSEQTAISNYFFLVILQIGYFLLSRCFNIFAAYD